MKANNLFALLKKKRFIYVLLTYAFLITTFFLGNNLIKKDETVWNNNKKIIEKIFVQKKIDCQNFLTFFDQNKISDNNTVFYILKNFKSKLERVNPDIRLYRQNLHNYLTKTLNINYYKLDKNVVLVDCISEDEILLIRLWKNKKATEEYMKSWQSK
jgi:hypothetical protein